MHLGHTHILSHILHARVMNEWIGKTVILSFADDRVATMEGTVANIRFQVPYDESYNHLLLIEVLKKDGSIQTVSYNTKIPDTWQSTRCPALGWRYCKVRVSMQPTE
jgi:hypothetical protein